MNLTAQHIDICYNKGDDIVFPFSVDLCNDDGTETLVDISGWTVSCTAEKVDAETIAGITVTTIDDYTRKITIPRTSTNADDRNMASYKIVCDNDDAERRTYIKGQLKQED